MRFLWVLLANDVSELAAALGLTERRPCLAGRRNGFTRILVRAVLGHGGQCYLAGGTHVANVAFVEPVRCFCSVLGTALTANEELVIVVQSCKSAGDVSWPYGKCR